MYMQLLKYTIIMAPDLSHVPVVGAGQRCCVVEALLMAWWITKLAERLFLDPPSSCGDAFKSTSAAAKRRCVHKTKYFLLQST